MDSLGNPRMGVHSGQMHTKPLQETVLQNATKVHKAQSLHGKSPETTTYNCINCNFTSAI